MTSLTPLREAGRPVTIAEIQRAVAEHFHVQMIEMVSQRRARVVARPRQIAMYLAKELTPFSLPVIGRHFGGRDHTTVMHAIRKVEMLGEVDRDIGEAVYLLRARLADPDQPLLPLTAK